LQNITDQQDELTAIADERRVIIFNGERWIWYFYLFIESFIKDKKVEGSIGKSFFNPIVYLFAEGYEDKWMALSQF
jgi:hypothetical protein